MLLCGELLSIDHPEKAIRSGMFLVPEGRRRNGIIVGQSLRDNILLPIWKRLMFWFFIQDRIGEEIVNNFVDDLNIRAASIEQSIELLSGGNQQKAVFAKSLATHPKILLLDDPTVGVDIATKKEIGQVIRDIARQGNGVIFVSSDMEEIADLCDRILVLHRGIITQEIDGNGQRNVTEEMLTHAIQRDPTAIGHSI